MPDEPAAQPDARSRPLPDDIAGWDERMAEGIASVIPMHFEHVSKERVVITMPVGPHVHQPTGILHGGASMVLAETAASVGAGLNCPPGMVAVGQEINGNHLRRKRDGLLRATAEPVHIGHSSQVWTVDIRDEAGKRVCIARLTLAMVAAAG